MTEKLIGLIREKYPLVSVDAGEYSLMKVSGMKFSISSYQAEGFGHLSVMTAKGFGGLMKMETVILVPLGKDAPLLSYDLVSAFGKNTLFLELYDTVVTNFDYSSFTLLKEKYSSIPDHDPGSHWYDSIRRKESIYKKTKKDPRLDELTSAFFSAYLSSDASETEDIEAKKKKTVAYVDGLLSHGGPSTDVFKKSIGEEKTASLFHNVLFGTAL